MSFRTIQEVEKAMAKMSEKDLKKKIEDEHDNLVNHATNLRKRAGKGKEAQKMLEEREAEKYRCIKVNGTWVQMYPDWKVPEKISNSLNKKA